MPALRIIGLAIGEPTSLDGLYVKEYDPSRDGVAPDGRPLRCHLVVTENRAEALEGSMRDMTMVLLTVDPRQPNRPDDGRPNRPLTAFHVELCP